MTSDRSRFLSVALALAVASAGAETEPIAGTDLEAAVDPPE